MHIGVQRRTHFLGVSVDKWTFHLYFQIKVGISDFQVFSNCQHAAVSHWNLVVCAASLLERGKSIYPRKRFHSMTNSCSLLSSSFILQFHIWLTVPFVLLSSIIYREKDLRCSCRFSCRNGCIAGEKKCLPTGFCRGHVLHSPVEDLHSSDVVSFSQKNGVSFPDSWSNANKMRYYSTTNTLSIWHRETLWAFIGV